LLQICAKLPFWTAAAMAACVFLVLISWQSRQSVSRRAAASEETFTAADPNLLLVARMGHFLAIFAVVICRNLFPKLGREYYSEGIVGTMIAIHLAGQAASMVAAGAGPWWRGKLWPLLCSQGLICLGGIALAIGHGAAAFALALFTTGAGLGISYTGSLYYGLQGRNRSGHNAGIHESLVAGAGIAGGLIGGAAAQWIGIRAPYVILSVLAALTILSSFAIGKSKPINTDSET